MERLSHILELNGDQLFFFCPGCKMHHSVRVRGDKQPMWGWNGDVVRPTFTPSILVRYTWGVDEVKKVCHTFVTDGCIRFLDDCTHELAGQTVAIPNLDDEDQPE